jgi:hypothetical protein
VIPVVMQSKVAGVTGSNQAGSTDFRFLFVVIVFCAGSDLCAAS